MSQDRCRGMQAADNILAELYFMKLHAYAKQVAMALPEIFEHGPSSAPPNMSSFEAVERSAS